VPFAGTMCAPNYINWHFSRVQPSWYSTNQGCCEPIRLGNTLCDVIIVTKWLVGKIKARDLFSQKIGLDAKLTFTALQRLSMRIRSCIETVPIEIKRNPCSTCQILCCMQNCSCPNNKLKLSIQIKICEIQFFSLLYKSRNLIFNHARSLLNMLLWFFVKILWKLLFYNKKILMCIISQFCLNFLKVCIF